MKYTWNQLSAVAAAAFLSTALFTACQDTDYPDPQPATGPSTNQARFLFVNAAPGVPALNFFIENNQVGQALQFGQSASAYAPAQAGSIQLRARAASGQIGGVLGSNDIVFRAGATNQNNFSAAANTSYTVFVTDTLNRPRPTTTNATNLGGPQFVVVTDTLTVPDANTARVRVFNFAPDVSPVSVRLLNPTTIQGAATFPNRAYSNVSATNLRYTNIPAGTYTVQVYTQASVPSAPTTPASTTANVTLAGGKIYTIYSAGLLRNRSLSVGTVLHN